MELIHHRSVGTMRLLRLPSPFSLPSVSLVFDTITMLPFLFVPLGGYIYPTDPDYSGTDNPLVRVSCGGGRLSQVPVDTYCTFALLLDPGRNAMPHLYLSASHYCSRCPHYESSNDKSDFEAHSHGFCTPCVRFVPTSLLPTQHSVTVAG